MRKSKGFLIAAVIAACIIALSACAGQGDKNYYKNVASYGFWENTGDQAIAQPDIYYAVKDHMESPLKEGTTGKKVAFIGYDGSRTDALVNAINSGVKDEKLNSDVYSGHNQDSLYSAVVEVRNMGGAYIAYTGGNKGGANEQHPSTAPGWMALLTGQWGIKNGVTNNGMVKNMDYKTFLLDYAETGIGIGGGKPIQYKTIFAASWGPHFTENYTPEVEYLAAHTDIPMSYRRTANDNQTHEVMKASVTPGGSNVTITVYDGDSEHEETVHIAESDIVFGIYEGTDHNGHESGFGNQNSKYVKGFRDQDNQAYEFIETIKARPTYATEDWLFIITTDHGGISTWHGGQSMEERTTWVITNKTIDSKYYSKEYDGYRAK